LIVKSFISSITGCERGINFGWLFAAFWLKFFRDAGIQAGIDKKYASIFEENRIKADMMMDLDKGLLKEMEITAVGDILAILKHAKRVNEQVRSGKIF
jgi:3-isopropylmalate dehydratase small subunit